MDTSLPDLDTAAAMSARPRSESAARTDVAGAPVQAGADVSRGELEALHAAVELLMEIASTPPSAGRPANELLARLSVVESELAAVRDPLSSARIRFRRDLTPLRARMQHVERCLRSRLRLCTQALQAVCGVRPGAAAYTPGRVHDGGARSGHSAGGASAGSLLNIRLAP